MPGSAPIVTLPPINLPVGATFAALAAGLALGWLIGGTAAQAPVLAIAGPVGTLWLRALQMTIIPLVVSLLVTGIAAMVATSRAGPMARRTLAVMFAVLAAGAVFAALAMPLLLELAPVPRAAAGALAGEAVAPQVVPGLGEFFGSLIAPNVVAAAAETAMLPVIVFAGALAFAATRLPPAQRDLLVGLFEALGNAMLVVIGWVLRAAPVGVFALAAGVAAQSGGGAILALGHYILLVSGVGLVVLLSAYVLAATVGRQKITHFARAMLPAQAVAISTQSSLASLPAMLVGCRTLGLRDTTADFVLPLAVAIFRATGPAMNLAVALYVAKLTGTVLTPGALAVGVLVALATTVGAVSLPGAISFVTSIGPIAVAMGVPVEPLALLVAVEMLPDIMRTLGNVTMNVAVVATVERGKGGD
jgi:Na+/H+-dicarboxylate symporter